MPPASDWAHYETSGGKQPVRGRLELGVESIRLGLSSLPLYSSFYPSGFQQKNASTMYSRSIHICSCAGASCVPYHSSITLSSGARNDVP